MWRYKAVHDVYRKSYPDYNGDDSDEAVEMSDASAGDSSSAVDESGYQLVLPSGNCCIYLYNRIVTFIAVNEFEGNFTA